MRQKLQLGFVVLLAGGVALWWLRHPNPEANALRVRALATRELARHLAQTRPGQKVLILSNPFTQLPGTAREIIETEAAGVRGLKEGFGPALALEAVAYPEVPPEALANPRAFLGDIETSTPLSYLIPPQALDQVARQHPACQLMVSLIGLPKDVEQSEAWNRPGSPTFALLWPDLRVIGNTAAVKQALLSGKLVAFVLRKPGAPSDAVALSGRDPEEFARRFLLVNRDTVDHVLQNHPGLF